MIAAMNDIEADGYDLGPVTEGFGQTGAGTTAEKDVILSSTVL